MNSAELEELLAQARLNTYRVHGDVRGADCVLAFSFGYIQAEAGIAPGLSNDDLAHYIERALPGLPVIAQFDVADALGQRSAELIIRRHRTEGAYLDSQEVARQAKDHMQARGWKSVVVATHPAMEARNDALCTAMGLKTVAPAGLEVIRYDPGSEQDWTRDPASWWKREAGVIVSINELGLLQRPHS